MAEDTAPDIEPDENTTETESDQDEQPNSATVSRSELDKAIARRDKALKATRELQAEIKALKEKGSEPSPLEKANERLIRSSARTALVAAGVGKEDAGAVLKVLDLSGITVDEDGEVDEDALEDAISALRRAFGTKQAKGTKVTARPAGKTPPVDADSARRRAFLAGYSR